MVYHLVYQNYFGILHIIWYTIIYLVYHLVYQNGIPVLFGIPNGIPKWYSIPFGTTWYTNGIVTTPGSEGWSSAEAYKFRSLDGEPL